jgi:hypothetical protein
MGVESYQKPDDEDRASLWNVLLKVLGLNPVLLLSAREVFTEVCRRESCKINIKFYEIL